MINFSSQNHFTLSNTDQYVDWITKVIETHNHKLGEIDFIFCSDEYLHKLNLEFLNHDTYTDIISFDYSVGKIVSGEIYISTDRVQENAQLYTAQFETELNRVIIHGILHFLGFKDKTKEEAKLMRLKEDQCLELF